MLFYMRPYFRPDNLDEMAWYSVYKESDKVTFTRLKLMVDVDTNKEVNAALLSTKQLLEHPRAEVQPIAPGLSVYNYTTIVIHTN